MAKGQSKGLGKGINALFASMEASKEESVQEISLNEIRPNPYQPRKIFHPEAINELKESIIHHGVLQPIIVRSSIKGYEIVVGERRYRASKEAGIDKIPAVVRNLTDVQMMELALLENLQREDLSTIEEAQAYELLLEKLDVTQEELAKRLGKSRPHISNHIRLLALPSQIQQWMMDNKLTMGHGRALLGLKKKNEMLPLAEKAVKGEWNVRQLESVIQQLNENVSRGTLKKKEKKDLFVQEQETLLRERFGTTVSIKKSKKKGKIEIAFFSEDDLTRILDLLESSIS
jgi:ParB family chromosome partitioning protein